MIDATKFFIEDKSNKIYTLMHKEIPVCKLEFTFSGTINKVKEWINIEHIPNMIWREPTRDLIEWWERRSAPMSRPGMMNNLISFGLSSTTQMAEKCFGFSLSDQYWLKDENRPDINYNDCNFFNNSFSEDIGDILIQDDFFEYGLSDKYTGDSFLDPSCTSDGEIPKKWKIVNGVRTLIKSSNIIKQQPYNEVLAMKLCKAMSFNHIDYKVEVIGEQPCNICDCFITKDTELVPALAVLNSRRQNNSLSPFEQYIETCIINGLDEKTVRRHISDTLVLDFIIGNSDRHLYNFGIIRNANTLEWVSTAPIFDTGNSLFYKTLTPDIRIGKDISSKPFKKIHSEQIKYVDISLYDFDKLDCLSDETYKTMLPLGDERAEKLAKAIKTRLSVITSL